MSVRFQPGGALRQDAIYVERRADTLLPAALLAGELSYVLAPRQMGKSSLRVRTETELRRHGHATVSIDVTALGATGATPETWYFGMIDEIARRLSLPDPAPFWSRHRRLSPVQRLSRYMKTSLLAEVAAPIVVFFDEIDAVRALPFPVDDFFAALRALYNERAEDRACERLTFCMMGVAAPTDLMADVTRTPFNVGRGIRLEDFDQEEAKGFLPGLASLTEEAQTALTAVLYWTHGHPYMTQRLCEALLRDPREPDLPVRVQVSRLINNLFFTRGRTDDLSLASMEREFQRARVRRRALEMLSLYGRLLADENILSVSDDPVQTALRLAGMAAERDDGASVWLRVRNPIVEHVFDDTWAQQTTTALERAPRKTPRARPPRT